jgi:hypothetical protein
MMSSKQKCVARAAALDSVLLLVSAAAVLLWVLTLGIEFGSASSLAVQ